MTPLPYVWPYALIFWAVFVWAYFPEYRIARSARRDQTALDSKSLQVIMLGQGTATFLSFAMARRFAWRIAPAHAVMVFLGGVAVIILGSLLRRHCWRMLGSSFTGDVRAHEGQEVVNRGAYRILRHPSYTAGIFLNLGLGLALGSWISVVLLTVMAFVVYAYRIAVEERTLVAVIGEPYREFMRTRKRLIPFIY